MAPTKSKTRWRARLSFSRPIRRPRSAASPSRTVASQSSPALPSKRIARRSLVFRASFTSRPWSSRSDKNLARRGLLAAIGLYGVTSYAVGRRRSEIGIRMALGATRAVILRQIVTRVLVLVGAGVLGGVGASLWASQLVSALLHAVDPGD